MPSNGPIIIIFPPAAFPGRPVLSLAALAGFLRDRGVEVQLEDYNIESYHFLLDPNRIDFYSRRIEKNLFDKRIPGNWKLKAVKTLARRQFLKKNLGPAKNILRHRVDYYKPVKRTWAMDTVGWGLKMVSAAYYPVKWDWGEFECEFHPGCSTDILNASKLPSSTPFNELFEQKVKKDIIPIKPLLIGISISYPYQVIPAFRLLRIIKHYLPKVHTTVGGAIFTRLAGEIPQAKSLFSVCGSFVINEGETALWCLYQALQGKKAWREVPNLIYKDGNHVHTNRFLIEKVEELPAPSFEGLPLEDYLSPEIVLQLETSRGCYWRKCTFCNLPKIQLERTHRPFPPEKLAERIEKLCRKYNSRWISFWDEAVPPATLLALSQGLLKKRVFVEWQAEIRFDASIDRPLLELMARAGCRGLFFGLESAHPRIQKLMGKPIDLDKFLEMMKNCRELDIHVNIGWFVGFPGETREEAQTTCDFLIENLTDNEYAWYPGKFILRKHSLIERHPERFGIEIIKDRRNDLEIAFYYRTRSGLTQREAHELRQEFLERFSAKGLDLEQRYGSAYLLYQSHYRTGKPDFYPPAKTDLMKFIDSRIKPALVKGIIQESFKIDKNGREVTLSVLVHPQGNSIVIKGEAKEQDFWLEEIDGVKTVGEIKQGFQQKFGSRSPWLAPYLKLVEAGFIEI